MADEPTFMAIRRNDQRVALAHAFARETLPRFRGLVQAQDDVFHCAKLRFRDPDASEDADEDRFFYLWLDRISFHEDENLFSGRFFEVPGGFEKYHAVGSRLGFAPEDIFDWMVNDHGSIRGAYTLRVNRATLSKAQREAFDRHLGATAYEPDTFDKALAALDAAS